VVVHVIAALRFALDRISAVQPAGAQNIEGPQRHLEMNGLHGAGELKEAAVEYLQVPVAAGREARKSILA
jgi:hypothetical protein